jgi:hypothetical protein
MPLSNGVTVVHGVECRNLIDTHWRHLQYPRNLIHDTQARKSMLSLSKIEYGHDCRLFVLGRVSLEDLVNELVVLLGELEGNIRIVLGCISML